MIIRIKKKYLNLLGVILLCSLGYAMTLSIYTQYNPSESNVTYIINSTLTDKLNVTVNATCVVFKNATHIDEFCNQSITDIYIYIYSPGGENYTLIDLGQYPLCDNTLDSEEVPCVYLIPSPGYCLNITYDLYLNGTTYYGSGVMSNYTDIFCGFVFNASTIGYYFVNITGASSDIIYVEEGKRMIYLLYFGIVLIISLMVLGLYLQNQPILAIDGFLMLVTGLWVFIQGFSIYNNMVTNIVATVLLALGMYFLTMSTLAMIDTGFENDYDI